MSRYHYIECGLPSVFIKGDAFEEAGRRGAIYDIPAVQILHTLIALGIVVRDFAISSVDFRYLSSEFSLSRRHWATRLGVGVEQIAAWESGADPIPLVLEVAIRQFIYEKIHGRALAFSAVGLGIDDDIETAQILMDELPRRVLRNAADREIEISHDGGGRYRLFLESD